MLARVEVVSAIWRKQRTGEYDRAEAGALTEDFELDWRGTEAGAPRFIIVPLTKRVLERAASLAASSGLRAYDAVQLASALAANEAQRDLALLCFDRRLRSAAADVGLALLPEA